MITMVMVMVMVMAVTMTIVIIFTMVRIMGRKIAVVSDAFWPFIWKCEHLIISIIINPTWSGLRHRDTVWPNNSVYSITIYLRGNQTSSSTFMRLQCIPWSPVRKAVFIINRVSNNKLWFGMFISASLVQLTGEATWPNNRLWLHHNWNVCSSDNSVRFCYMVRIEVTW